MPDSWREDEHGAAQHKPPPTPALHGACCSLLPESVNDVQCLDHTEGKITHSAVHGSFLSVVLSKWFSKVKSYEFVLKQEMYVDHSRVMTGWAGRT